MPPLDRQEPPFSSLVGASVVVQEASRAFAAELVATGLTYAEAGEIVGRSERTLPTRVAAVKTLAALRPDAVEQVEPQNEQQPTPSIVVNDLPPGAGPVVHYASSGGEPPVSAADTPQAKQPPDSDDYTFVYEPPDGKHDIIGSWSPPRLDQSANGFVKIMIVRTDDPAEAEHWRAELAAGRFPVDIENER